jgi:hypothetical protein
MNTVYDATIQPSLRDGINIFAPLPGVETPGYHRPSLRD